MNILSIIRRYIGKEKIRTYAAAPAAGADRSCGETYSRMLQDPVISGAVDLLILKTVGEGMRLEGEDKALNTFLTDMLNGFSLPLSEILREALSAIVYGSAVFEKIFEYRNGCFVIGDLKYKPPGTYRFRLDDYGNLKGIITRENEVLPPEKFFVFVNKGAAGNGISSLSPCRPLWHMKREKVEEYGKYLTLYGSPALIGTIPESFPLCDRQRILGDMGKLKSGGTMVVSSGTEINQIKMQNNESLYLNFIDFCNREMVTAILGSNRATMEARYGSRADSETSLLLIEDKVKFYRQNLAEAVKDSLLYPIAEANLGREAADRLTPAPEFVPDRTEDIISYGGMIGKLYSSGYLDPSQTAGIDAMLRLPERRG